MNALIPIIIFVRSNTSVSARAIDFLAVRLGGSVERVGTEGNRKALRIDTIFLDKLGVGVNDSIGLVVEVKGGNENARIEEVKFRYAKPFFGMDVKIRKVGFENKGSKIAKVDDQVVVPMKYSLNFIRKRFEELKQLDEELRGTERMTKEGSWHLSEEFLSDLIYLRKLGSN